MPFTPAHVAAVLPVVGRERPRWAVPSALVIGSMVPDVLYFVPISSHRDFSHSLLGVLTLDLALGLPAFKVAQYGSGVVGVVLVLGYGLRALTDTPADNDDSPLATPLERSSAWLVLLVVPIVCALTFTVAAMVAGVGTEMLLYVAVVRGVGGLGLAVTAVAVWWHRWVRPRGPQHAVHSEMSSRRESR